VTRISWVKPIFFFYRINRKEAVQKLPIPSTAASDYRVVLSSVRIAPTAAENKRFGANM
jgi:hypothetical protein